MPIFGYMTAAEAVDEGFTHHGSYYGLPIWWGEMDGCPLVAVKWQPANFLMDWLQELEMLLAPIARPGVEPFFLFKVGKPIEVPS